MLCTTMNSMESAAMQPLPVCVVCFDEVHGAEGSVSCSGSSPHHMCLECFAQHVTHSCSNDVGVLARFCRRLAFVVGSSRARGRRLVLL